MIVPIAPDAGGQGGTSSIASPAVIVVLVLLLGATVYLWRSRYMRRKTAYGTIGVLVLLLLLVGLGMYKSGG